MTYYNTTNETNPELNGYREQADRQEDVILAFFRDRVCAAPSDVFIHFSYPITSVRRTISDLTKQGHLVKTEVKKKGFYGRNEHIWRLK